MTDETVNLNPNEPVESELDVLKARARMMGIEFHSAIGLSTLQARVDAHVAGNAPPVEAESESSVVSMISTPVAETAAQAAVRLKREALALVRVRVTCMNPNKREYEGEIFTTGNSVVGTIKKYVPFDTDWHVEQMILTMIQERQCQTFYTVRDDKGRKTRKGKLIPEFSIALLPTLTEEELHDLAQRQAMSAGTAAA